MSLESWKSIFDVAAVVLLFLTFAAGWGVLLTGNRINRRQELQLRKFDTDLTAAKMELVEQQARTASAQAGQQHVELALEEQREKTAEAEVRLIEVAKLQSPRFIQDHAVSASLKDKPTGSVAIWYQPDDPEAYWFAFSIMSELNAAHWRVQTPVPIPETSRLWSS